jgi:predicted dehydrogenase
MKPVRIALMGAGLIGREHAALIAAHPAAELAGIADVAPEAGPFAAGLGTRCFDSFVHLLEQTAPDGAIVALPNALHLEAGLACIERRVPVLVEKPIADTVEAAMQLVRAGESAGVPVLVGHHRRHSPDIREAHRAIARGDLGALVAIGGMCLVRKHETYYDVRWRRERGGGPLLINAIHDIDCFRHLCGEIERVQAIGSSAARGFEVEDTVAVSMRFENGALGTFVLSDAAPSPYFWETASGQALYFPGQPEDSYFIAGRTASLAVPSLNLWRHEGDGDWRDPLVRRHLHAARTSCYVAQLDNLVAVIRGEAQPVVSGRDGAMTLAATLAIGRAMVEDRTVRVSEMLR